MFNSEFPHHARALTQPMIAQISLNSTSDYSSICIFHTLKKKKYGFQSIWEAVAY